MRYIHQIGRAFVANDLDAKCWVIWDTHLEKWLPLPYTNEATRSQVEAYLKASALC